MKENVLEIKDLSVAFYHSKKPVPVTSDISYGVAQGEILGIVGESGSGKSVTAKTVMRLLNPHTSKIMSGEVWFEGENLLKSTEKKMRTLRGSKIAMIFQEPMTSLNPLYTCGDQIMEALMLHQKLKKKDAFEKGVEMMQLVGIPNPRERMKCFPNELSGGMRQRVMIAMALSCNPKLLIADEPTTALDPTIQAQILQLIKEVQKDRDMSVMYITHDLGVVAEVCDRVVVMYAGMTMEIADVDSIFHNPLHPYTQELLKAMPRIDQKVDKLYNIKGMVPPATEMPEGCHFYPRCNHADEKCKQSCPSLIDAGNGHCVRCWHYKEIQEDHGYGTA